MILVVVVIARSHGNEKITYRVINLCDVTTSIPTNILKLPSIWECSLAIQLSN